MVFVSAWPVLNWVLAGFWINFVCLTNPWKSHHYDSYKEHSEKFPHGWFFFYPPPWAYKIIWGLVNSMVAAGGIIAMIQLNPTTEWFVSIFALAYANIYAQKYFPVFYFEWHNYRSFGTYLTLFIVLTAGGTAGLIGYRAFEEDQMSVWAAFVFWAVYFFWSSYSLCLIMSTQFPIWDPLSGIFMSLTHQSNPHKMPGPQGMNTGMFSEKNGKGMFMHHNQNQHMRPNGGMNMQGGMSMQGSMSVKNW
jgi:hypothetical protein